VGCRPVDLRARDGEPSVLASRRQRRHKTIGAAHRRPLGPDDRQRQEVPVVTGKAWQKACPQEGRLADTRGAENDKEARGCGFSEPAQRVERLDHGPLAAEEYTGVEAQLWLILGDGVNQAADLASGATSIPSWNLTPWMTFGNWF
jgi:hypothetical protein